MQKYLHEVDLNLLVTFNTFVQVGSVAATAEALGRSQPAISSRLRQLQEDMGVPLLERHGRRLRLTSVGRSLDARLGVVLRQMADLVEEVRAAAEEPVGLLRIGALPTAHVHFLAPCLASLTRAHSRIRVEVVPGHVAPQLQALHDGDVDAVLGVGDVPTSGLVVDVLAHACAVVVSKQACFSRAPSRKALRAQPWLSYGSTGDPFFESTLEFQASAGVRENVVLTVPHINSLKALIAAGAGIAILPDYTVAGDTRLASHGVRGLDVRLPIWLALRPGSQKIPSIVALRERSGAQIARSRRAFS